MTFSDYVTIFIVVLLGVAIIVALGPSLFMLLSDLFWFATKVVLLYFIVTACMNIVNVFVRFLRLISLRSLRA